MMTNYQTKDGGWKPCWISQDGERMERWYRQMPNGIAVKNDRGDVRIITEETFKRIYSRDNP